MLYEFFTTGGSCLPASPVQTSGSTGLYTVSQEGSNMWPSTSKVAAVVGFPPPNISRLIPSFLIFPTLSWGVMSHWLEHHVTLAEGGSTLPAGCQCSRLCCGCTHMSVPFSWMLSSHSGWPACISRFACSSHLLRGISWF